MTSVLQLVDGSKGARFDGLVLDISGLNGSADVKRVTIANIDKISVEPSGDEWLLLVRLRQGGFSAAISASRKAEWERLVQAVQDAKNALTVEP